MHLGQAYKRKNLMESREFVVTLRPN